MRQALSGPSCLLRPAFLTWLLLAAALQLLACGKKGVEVTLKVTAKVDPYHVTIEVRADDPVKVRLRGDPAVERLSAQTVTGGRALFTIPIEDLKPGTTYHISAVVSEAGSRGSSTVTFTTRKVKPKVVFESVMKQGPLVSMKSHRPSTGMTFINLDPAARIRMRVKEGAGNKLLIGGKELTLKTGTLVTIDPREFMAVQTVSALQEDRFVVPGKLVSAKGDTFDDPMVFSGRSLAKYLFQRIVTGGLHFAKDVSASAKPRGYVMVTPKDKHYMPQYRIPSGKLSHADLVVVRTRNLVGAGSCGPYRIVGKGGRVRMKKYITEIVLTVYDRRTGKKLQTKTFRGTSPRCPRRATTVSFSLFGSDPKKAVRRWLEGLLKP